MRPHAGLTVACAFALLLPARDAGADPQCTTVAQFNDLMASENGFASSVTLSFQVTGVNPADYPEGKGWLIDMVDGSCSTGATAALKVYGTTADPNPAHPAGTVKLEHGSACCTDSQPCTEHWA